MRMKIGGNGPGLMEGATTTVVNELLGRVVLQGEAIRTVVSSTLGTTPPDNFKEMNAQVLSEISAQAIMTGTTAMGLILTITVEGLSPCSTNGVEAEVGQLVRVEEVPLGEISKGAERLGHT